MSGKKKAARYDLDFSCGSSSFLLLFVFGVQFRGGVVAFRGAIETTAQGMWTTWCLVNMDHQ